MSRYVSIAELLPESHVEPHHVEASKSPLLWDMSVPEDVDAERIRINMSRLRLIHGTGAVAASFVEGYESNVAGDPDDSSGDKTAQLSTGIFTDRFDSRVSMGKSFGLINLNATYGDVAITHQIDERLLKALAEERIESGVDREVAWAQLYDQALRHSMRQGVHKHLMGRKKDVPSGYVRYAYGTTAAAVGGVAGAAAGFLPAELALLTTGYYDLCQVAIGLGSGKKLTRNGEKLGRRWSVVPFARQPDRDLAVNVLSRMSGLVEVAS